jgi:hypothetical protein
MRHGITHHRITAAVAAINASEAKRDAALPAGMRWVPRLAVEENLVSNLDRKAWKVYLAQREQATRQASLFPDS